MADTTAKLLEKLNRIIGQVDTTKSQAGNAPLFIDFNEFMQKSMSAYNIKYYIDGTPDGVEGEAETYQLRMKHFKEFVKGKSLSEKERRLILYGS